jgi:hypothetical protein
LAPFTVVGSLGAQIRRKKAFVCEWRRKAMKNESEAEVEVVCDWLIALAINALPAKQSSDNVDVMRTCNRPIMMAQRG